MAISIITPIKNIVGYEGEYIDEKTSEASSLIDKFKIFASSVNYYEYSEVYFR